MSPEKSCSESPFSALSYPTASMPLRMPNMALAAPPRHRELDQVISRHAQALRKAGAFQPLSTK